MLEFLSTRDPWIPVAEDETPPAVSRLASVATAFFDARSFGLARHTPLEIRPMANPLFARKPLAMLLEELEGKDRLKRVLGPVGLTSMGIGAVIGAGIFVSTGQAAHQTAGPSLMLSYAVSGIGLHLRRALLRRVRVDGPGRRVGLHLRLCHPRRAVRLDHRLGPPAGVCRRRGRRGQQLVVLLPGSDRRRSGLPPLPKVVSGPIVDVQRGLGRLERTGSYVNLPAVLIVAAVTALLVKGIQESARFNAVMVGRQALVRAVRPDRRRLLRQSSELEAVRPLRLRRPQLPRLHARQDGRGRPAAGHARRRGHRLLLLHRLRRGLDAGRGSKEPQPRRADRDPGVAAHLHAYSTSR